MANKELKSRCEEISNQLMNMALSNQAGDVRRLVIEYEKLERVNSCLIEALHLLDKKDTE